MKLPWLKAVIKSNRPDGALVGAALVRTSNGVAIAIEIGENLSGTWQSGDLMFLWTNGEHTSVYEDEIIEVLNANLFGFNCSLPETLTWKPCEICGSMMGPHPRSDQVTCSDRCRKAKSRHTSSIRRDADG